MGKNKKVRLILSILGTFLVVALATVGIIKYFIIDKEETEMVIKPEQEVVEETPEPEPEPEPEPVVTTITISAAGDVTLGNTQLQGYANTFNEMYDLQGSTYFFSGVDEVFATDDVTIINFEGVLTDSTNRIEKAFNLKGKPEYMQILKDGNIEVAGFSNNHCRDYGEESYTDTIELFKEYEVVYAVDETVGVYETKGIRVGMVAVNGLRGESSIDYARSGLEQLESLGADIKIVYIHWGIEGDNYANSTQENWGHQMADMGFDVVLGSHPHVLQGVEIYNNVPIVYSLGNFCFGGNMNPKVKDTMIYQQTFTFVDGVLQEDLDVRVIPCTISSVDWRNDFCPTNQIGTERGASIMEKINTYSSKWGTVFNEDGTLNAGFAVN